MGLLAARFDPQHRRVFWSVLSMAPDADVVGFAFGIPYADPFGHRGAAHSILAACVAALAVGLAHREQRARFVLLALLAIGSHALLDALTDGGLGVALAWPFANDRFFAPWRPIPVAPIGLGFLSKRGMLVAATELFYFLPVFAWALWPRRKRE